jgi:hypothetical protein
MMDVLFKALADGKLCVIDVSQLRGGPSLILSGLILRQIFDHNQNEFVKADSKTIPVIAVIEEAQSVLTERASASGPYIEWVKEGRKYDLGAILITQQPGSIPTEILSQGDNWFVFHLLSEGDLRNVQKANAHFSEDILSSLLNEPIPGQGVFWSGVGKMKYPIPLRVLLFQEIYPALDLDGSRSAIETYASNLRGEFNGTPAQRAIGPSAETSDDVAVVEGADPFRAAQRRAIEALGKDDAFRRGIDGVGIPYGAVVGLLKNSLPANLNDRENMAYRMVPTALNQLFGPRGKAWDTEKRDAKDGRRITWVVRLRPT